MAEEPFEYGAFQQTLIDLWVLLNELQYVDEATDFLMSEGQQQPWPLVVHTIGHTYPFEIISSPRPDIAQDEGGVGVSESGERQRLEIIWENAQSSSYDRLLDVGERCDLITRPVVEDFDAVTQTLDGLTRTVEDDNSVALGTTGFGITGSAWEGNAAASFNRGFLQPFEVVRENQLIALAQAAACVGAAKVCVGAGQNALMNVAVTAKQAVKDQLKNRQDRQRGGTVDANTLRVIGTGLGIVGTLAGLTGVGAPVTAFLSISSASLGYAASQVPPADAESYTFTVASAEETWSEIISTVMAIRATYLSDMISIGYRASAARRAVGEDETDGLLYPPAPRLDGVPPGDFHHGSSEQY